MLCPSNHRLFKNKRDNQETKIVCYSKDKGIIDK